MLYIYLDKSHIKLLMLKKSILGQYESTFYSKSFQTELVKKGEPVNPDFIASSLKEVLSSIPDQPIKEKEVILVLPQEAFLFFRADMPIDVTESVLKTYLIDKARAHLKSDIDNSSYDYLVKESQGKKEILYYAVKKEILESYEKPLSLIDLELKQVIPESLAYFKLFEKTLRQNKTENIWYVSYDQDTLRAYVYDSFGLIEESCWVESVTNPSHLETALKKQVEKLKASKILLNRLILSGKQSEEIRQDTFTKNVGVWTNPLKRIIPHFYSEYVKMLKGQKQTELPILSYDMLLGAFIFTLEEKQFSIYKSAQATKLPRISGDSGFSFPLKKLVLSKKGVFIFIISFVLTLGALFLYSQMKLGALQYKLPSLAFLGKTKPTPTEVILSPTVTPPTPTPTPAIIKTDVKIKILNGSGIKGKASVVKDFLKNAGYEQILTGNADAFDYEQTVIKTKKDAESLRDLIRLDIKTELEKEPQFETLDDAEPSDVIIIVGTDFR